MEEVCYTQVKIKLWRRKIQKNPQDESKKEILDLITGSLISREIFERETKAK